MAVVPFVLSLFLREVPLRTTLGRTQPSAPAAAAGADPDQRLLDADGADPAAVPTPSTSERR